MTTRVIIDAIQLNDDCYNHSVSTPTTAPRRRDPQISTPQCSGTFRFHTVDDAGHITSIPQQIPFQQTGVNVTIPNSANAVVLLHASNYSLNQVLTRPDTQSLFTFARLLGDFRRGGANRIIGPDVSPELNPPSRLTPQVQATRQALQNLLENAGQAHFNFVMFGDIDRPDNTQNEYFNTMLEQLYESGIQSSTNLPALLSALISCNQNSFGVNSPFVRRAQVVLNLFYINRGIQGPFMASLTPELKLRMKGLFSRLAGHLYLNSPDSNELGSFIRSLALDLYRLAPQGNPSHRINLYSNLIESLSGDIINPQECDMGDSASNRRVALTARQPFDVAANPQASRLNTLLRELRAAVGNLNENLLRYETLPPLQAAFDSIYEPFATQQGRQALVTRITTNTQIVRPAHLTAQWLAENGNLREALEACLFDPAHPERGSLTLVTGPDNQAVFQLNVSQLIQNVNALYAMQVSVPLLRNNVNALLGANLTNRREFQATVLALLFSLLGERAQNTSLSAFVAGQMRSIPLRISEPDRGDLERFYAEHIRDLGRRDALTEVLAPTIQGVACAAGVATSIGMFATGEQNSGQFSPGLAAGGFLTGAGCAPLTARLFTGTPQNAWRQWGTVGGSAGVGLGVLMGFLPMIISAANGGTPPMMMTPPMPMGRPRDARNPTSGYGP